MLEHAYGFFAHTVMVITPAGNSQFQLNFSELLPRCNKFLSTLKHKHNFLTKSTCTLQHKPTVNISLFVYLILCIFLTAKKIIMILTSHQTFSGQLWYLTNQIKFDQTNLLLHYQMGKSINLQNYNRKTNVWTIFNPYQVCIDTVCIDTIKFALILFALILFALILCNSCHI